MKNIYFTMRGGDLTDKCFLISFNIYLENIIKPSKKHQIPAVVLLNDSEVLLHIINRYDSLHIPSVST